MPTVEEDDPKELQSPPTNTPPPTNTLPPAESPPPYESLPPEAIPEEAKKPARPPLSLGMPTDDYCSAVAEDRKVALDAEQEAMNKRHAEETKTLEDRHATEVNALKAKREKFDDELAAIRQHVDMWHRHDEELATLSGAPRDAAFARHDIERAELPIVTGYDVRRPTVGDTVVQGFSNIPLRGHPWVRPTPRVQPPSRLHAET